MFSFRSSAQLLYTRIVVLRIKGGRRNVSESGDGAISWRGRGMSPAVVAQTYIGLHAELEVNVDHRYLLPAL